MAERTDYPSNSHKSKAVENTTRPEITPVAKGVAKKRPFSKRFAEAFLGDDVQTIKEHLLWSVAVPAIKDVVEDLVNNGTSMLLRGTSRSTARTYRSGLTSKPRTSYSSMSRSGNKTEKKDKPVSRGDRFEDVILDSRADAELVLDGIVERVAEYDWASVRDLYELAEIKEFDYIAENWGWDDLELLSEEASVDSVRGGDWHVNLPRPKALKR